MAIFTSKSTAAQTAALPPAELIAHAEGLLAEAEGGIKNTPMKDIAILKANLAGAYAQLAMAKQSISSTAQVPGPHPG